MASLTAVRILCSIAVTNNLPLMHSDIPQAFIQSMLDSDSSWMTLPKGVSLLDTKGNPHTLVKLMKALYGLKQSPQLWSKTLGNFFRDEGKLTHYAAGEIRSYTLYFPMHRTLCSPVDGPRFVFPVLGLDEWFSSSDLQVSVNLAWALPGFPIGQCAGQTHTLVHV